MHQKTRPSLVQTMACCLSTQSSEPMMVYCQLNPWETRTTRTPAFWGYSPLPHDYPYYWFILDPKSKEEKVKVTNLKNLPKLNFLRFRNNHYMRHTFWSCLISCANMKWIRRVLLKIQSGHDSVHRQTDGQTDGQTEGRRDGQGETSIPPFNFVEARGIKINAIWIKNWLLLFKKIHMKLASAKYWPLCLGFNLLNLEGLRHPMRF